MHLLEVDEWECRPGGVNLEAFALPEPEEHVSCCASQPTKSRRCWWQLVMPEAVLVVRPGTTSPLCFFDCWWVLFVNRAAENNDEGHSVF